MEHGAVSCHGVAKHNGNNSDRLGNVNPLDSFFTHKRFTSKIIKTTYKNILVHLGRPWQYFFITLA